MGSCFSVCYYAFVICGILYPTHSKLTSFSEINQKHHPIGHFSTAEDEGNGIKKRHTVFQTEDNEALIASVTETRSDPI